MEHWWSNTDGEEPKYVQKILS